MTNSLVFNIVVALLVLSVLVNVVQMIVVFTALNFQTETLKTCRGCGRYYVQRGSACLCPEPIPSTHPPRAT